MADPDAKLTEPQRIEYLKRYQDNLPYIMQQAYYYARKYNQADKVEDFVQEGCLALVSAVKGFDPDRGVPFLSYFMYWVQLRMKNYCLANMYCIRVPDRQIKKFEQYKDLKERGLTEQQIADALCVKVASIKNTLINVSRAQTINFTDLAHDTASTIDKSASRVGHFSFGENAILEDNALPPAGENIENVVIENITNLEYESLFDSVLDDFETVIIKRHYGFDGEAISLNKLRHEIPRNGVAVSRERLRQKKEKAHSKLRLILEKRRGCDPSGNAEKLPEGK